MEEDTPQTNGSSNGSSGFDGGEAKIGDILERARVERGLSLQEVEHATKIRKRYLAGLEQEDFGALPDSVYVQGFLKTYANFLGLDGEELSNELKRRRGRRRDKRQPGVGQIKKSGFDRPVLGPGGLSQAQGRKVSPSTLFTLLIAVLALTAVIGALYFVGRDTQTAGNSDASPPSSEQAPPSDDASQNEPDNAPNDESNGEAAGGGSDTGNSPDGEAANGESGSGSGQAEGGGAAGSGEVASVPAGTLAVTVSVEGADSWLSVSADGVVAYEQVAPPGFSDTFEADEDVSLSTGNAGALRVEVNGQDIGPVGADGEVIIDRSFTLKDAG